MGERNENLFTNLGKAFTDDLKKVVQQVVSSAVGKKSDLADSVEFVPQRNSLYMYVNDYYKAVSEGRKPKKKKLPIMVLINWIKKNGIQPRSGYSVNQLAYVIQNSIYKQGIKGKNFIESLEGSITDIVEIRIADNLEAFIADSLFTSFQIK
jgi:hypothetical protein